MILLMLRTKEIVDCLHRIEGFDRHLYEYRVPVAHRTVPQARQLQCLQLTAILALEGDEASVLIHIFRQVVFLALVVLHRTNQIYRVEVRTLLEHRFLRRILHVNL